MKITRPSLKLSVISLLLAALIVITAACGNNANDAASSSGDGSTAAGEKRLSVVTSFYPLYYMTTEIGGEHVKAVNLIAAGVEPHDWTPKSRDLDTASKAQLFLYHGAGLEGWVDDFLSGMSKGSTVVAKEISKGIALISTSEDEDEAGEEVSHQHEHDHNNIHVDPHTWASPKSALILAENVKNSLIEVDAVNKADYEKNYEALKQKLDAVDADYTSKLAQTTSKDIVVSHHAFGYLARDYGLNQIAIMGLSPDAEPRAQDLLRISKYVKKNNVKYIFFEELVSDRLAKTLAKEANVETMVLNPLEGLTPKQQQAGETYVTLMERNLQNLLQALQ